MVLAVVAASTSEPAVGEAEAASMPSSDVSAYREGRGEHAALALAAAYDVGPAMVARASVSVDRFPGRTYGNFTTEQCGTELDARAIPYAPAGAARGVDAPVRLTGALHGVLFHGDHVDWDTSARREVLDCRLVLALDDLAEMLAARGVREVVHMGIYRGDAPIPAHGFPRHHVAGLAIDVAAFVKDDGTRLEVLRDFHGHIGGRTCGGDGVRRHDEPTSDSSTSELRGLLCDIADEKTFHQILTPNHNAEHRNHFHLEVMRKTSWTMLQ